MSDERYESLLDELRAEDDAPPADLRKRLAGRLSATVAGGAEALASADLASEVLGEMASEGAATAAGMVSTKVAIWMTVAGLAVGGVGGAAGYHLVRGGADPVLVPAAADAGVEPADAGVAEPDPFVDAGTPDAGGATELDAGVTDTASPPTTEGTEASRRRERVLLRQAQNALVRERPADALSALARHRRQFPTSTFDEERDALEVQALAAAGRTDEAARKAAAFEAAHPGSIFLPRVRAATR